MTTTARDDLLAAGLTVFERDGFEGATVAAIRNLARTSNGSFFHFFGSKKELAGTLFLEILRRYHASVVAALDPQLSAREGIARLIGAHLDWVVNNRCEARFLFEISRAEWTEEVRSAQRAENSRLAQGVERWRHFVMHLSPQGFARQMVSGWPPSRITATPTGRHHSRVRPGRR